MGHVSVYTAKSNQVWRETFVHVHITSGAGYFSYTY